MSDCVIRFGGNYCNNNPFIAELSNYISDKEGKIFIVVSSNNKIKSLIAESIENVFHSGLAIKNIEEKLKDIFREETGKKVSSPFLLEVEKLNRLLSGIQLIGDYSSALENQVLSFSEILTTLILHSQISDFKPSQVIMPEEIGLNVTSDYGNATYTSISNEKVEKLPAKGVFLIPGSYGITTQGKTARAGFAAADYTAAAITSFLEADKLILWGMEKDFFSADPEIIKNPLKINRLTYSEASELAYFDHYSIHPRIVEPLEKKHIPVQVVSAESFKIETVINTETYISERIVKSVSYSDDISIIQLNGPGVGLKPGILAKVTGSLNNAGINIKSVITAQVSINILVNRNNGEKAIQLVESLGFESVKEIHLENDVSLIGIIGHGLQQNYGIAAKLFNAVAKSKVSVLLSGSGSADLVSYIVVKKDDRNVCVREIHDAFFNTSSDESNK